MEVCKICNMLFTLKGCNFFFNCYKKLFLSSGAGNANCYNFDRSNLIINTVRNSGMAKTNWTTLTLKLILFVQSHVIIGRYLPGTLSIHLYGTKKIRMILIRSGSNIRRILANKHVYEKCNNITGTCLSKKSIPESFCNTVFSLFASSF